MVRSEPHDSAEENFNMAAFEQLFLMMRSWSLQVEREKVNSNRWTAIDLHVTVWFLLSALICLEITRKG